MAVSWGIRLCVLPPLTNPNYFLSQSGVQSWPASCANAYLSCVTYIHMVFIIIKNRLSSICFHGAEALACLSNTQHFRAIQAFTIFSFHYWFTCFVFWKVIIKAYESDFSCAVLFKIKYCKIVMKWTFIELLWHCLFRTC